MRAKLAMLSIAAGLVIAAACGGGPPPPPPGPDPDSLAEAERIRDSIAAAAAAEQARADSIARERQRLEEERVRTEREETARRETVTAEVRNLFAAVINFDFDRYNIRPGTDVEVLEMKLRILQANPALQIEITGHCDERGSDEYNQTLGNRRGMAARDWLVNRGIDAGRITTRTMGEEQPVDPGHNEDAWARNRRDEFRITAGGAQLVMPSGM